jgi:hypothetical protein
LLGSGKLSSQSKESEWISFFVGDWTYLRWKKIKGRKENLIWKSRENHKFIFSRDY